MNPLEDFKNKLIGTYHNQRQAFNNPSLWAHIYIKFDELDKENIDSKSWYAVGSKDKPYRSTNLKLSVSGDDVLMTPHNKLTNTKICEILFKYQNNYWIGSNNRYVIPDLIKNSYVSTFLKFDGINYYSRDAGYDLNTNEYLWGKTNQTEQFHFIKL